jgi:hypothetical protein
MGWAVDPSKPKLYRYVLLFNYEFVKRMFLIEGCEDPGCQGAGLAKFGSSV